MTQKQRSLIGGVSVLALAGLICKVVGVLYRIPLANTIGGDGLGLYSKVFQSYNLLLTISSAGIPVAISRMVSHYVARGEEKNAKRIFRIALYALTALGLIATLLLILGAQGLASMAGAPEIRVGYLAIAPSLLLVCVMSAFRGYMQGHRQMMPTAISQLIEQVGKLVVALPLATIGFAREGAALGAAGMLLGTSIAEAVALAFMIFSHMRKAGDWAEAALADHSPTEKSSRILGRLCAIAIPITIGACIVPLAGWIDSFMVTNLMEANGITGFDVPAPSLAGDLETLRTWAQSTLSLDQLKADSQLIGSWSLHKEALVRYGLYSSVVLSLINVPTAIAMAVSTNLVPAISAGCAKGDKALVARESLTGLRMASVIGLPCSAGMSILAQPILYMLFSGKYTPAQLDIASQVLQVSALTIVLFTMVQATSGILQGCGKQRIPMYTLAAGVACKIGLNMLLIGNPDINIHGAPIASLTCYFVSMVPNLYYVKKYTGCKMDISQILLRPLAATAVMSGAVWAVWRFVFGASALQSRMLTALAVIVCLTLGVIVYAVCATLFRAIRAQDVPGRLRPRRYKNISANDTTEEIL